MYAGMDVKYSIGIRVCVREKMEKSRKIYGIDGEKIYPLQTWRTDFVEAELAGVLAVTKDGESGLLATRAYLCVTNNMKIHIKTMNR